MGIVGAGALAGTVGVPADTAATTAAPANWRSNRSMRSAKASKVVSDSGRTMRVKAISKVSRGFVDVFRSLATSPSTSKSLSLIHI